MDKIVNLEEYTRVPVGDIMAIRKYLKNACGMHVSTLCLIKNPLEGELGEKNLDDIINKLLEKLPYSLHNINECDCQKVNASSLKVGDIIVDTARNSLDKIMHKFSKEEYLIRRKTCNGHNLVSCKLIGEVFLLNTSKCSNESNTNINHE